MSDSTIGGATLDETVVAERFELLRIVGEGGMAIVYEARDRRTGKTVAVKIVEGVFANERFEREASVLARLDHPGIVGYVHHGRLARDRMFLAMEWLDGESLYAHLKAGGPMPLADVLALGTRLARALAVAHAAGVVHRDVKPHNVILRGGHASDAVLVDFGIARALDAGHLLTAGRAIGTPRYMSPEQVRGDPHLDFRADIFSLGCVLFECLAGRPAFAGDGVVAFFAKILVGEAPRVGALRSDVPESLDQLVASMLAKPRDERPSSIALVADALESIRERNAASLVPSSKAPGIGAVERRLATVLLTRPRTHQPDDAAVADTLAAVTSDAVLGKFASELGMRLHRLADGALVGVISGGPEHHGGAEAAARVVRCALRLAADLEGSEIAVATGRAVIAGELPIGSAIDRAAKLLANGASRGQVWLCERTAALVDERFDLVVDEDRARVIGERARLERPRTVLGRSTPCVGRDRELALLEATFREAIDEPVAMPAVVVGPPGIGKSRLQREFVERARAIDARTAVWAALGEPAMHGAQFALVGDLLRRVFRVSDGESLVARREKVMSYVVESRVAQPERVARRLGEICGTTFDDEDDALRAARRDPPLLAQQVTDAFTSFVRAVLATRPVVIVAEDVHWADAASLRLFDVLLASAGESPLMMLALARPQIDATAPRLWEQRRCQRIVLEPLRKKAATQLARAVLGDGVTTDVGAIVSRAGGNALFVEELARAFAEGRAGEELPPTIAAVTEARLAALPDDTRRVLRAAAIFGERFWPGGVVHVMGGTDAAAIDDRLHFLEEHEIASREPSSRFRDETQYVFRHALVRDAAYAMLTDEDRTLGHNLAGEWLEQRVDDGALLAPHYEKGARLADAARWYARAAEQALAANDFEAVTRHTERAEAVGASGPVLGCARLAEAEAAFWLGSNDAAAKAAIDAVKMLERATEKWFVALGVGLAATGKIGDIGTLVTLVNELERTEAPSADAGRAKAIARARAAIQLVYFGEIPRADALIDGCDREPGAPGDKSVLGWVLQARFERGLAAGEPEHVSMAQRGREVCMQNGDPRAAFGQWFSEIQFYAAVGDFDRALSSAEGLARAAGAEAKGIAVHVKIQEALVATARGDLEPMMMLTRMLATQGNPRLTTNGLSTMAQLLFGAGRIAEAKDHATRALEIVPGTWCYQAVAHAVLARAAAKEGDAESALVHSERGLRLAEHGVPLYGATTIMLARYDALRAAGRADEALVALRDAMASLERRSRHLGEYRAVLLRSWGNPELLELARAQRLG